MTVHQREITFQIVRDRKPTPEKLLALVTKHGKELKKDPAKARAFFTSVGIFTPGGGLAKPYSSSK